jgi:Glyoxalase-like domain
LHGLQAAFDRDLSLERFRLRGRFPRKCVPVKGPLARPPGRLRDVDLIWEQVVVDAHDPVALGRWWAEALGWVVVGDAADEFEIRPTPDRVPGLLFVPVPEEKAGKNRLHLDFRPVDQTAEVERLLSLGARRADVGQRDVSWVVLADPEGNEFCILRGRVRPDS